MDIKLTKAIINIAWIFIILGSISFTACRNEGESPSGSTEKVAPVKVPRFNGDSAMVFLEKQLSFGFRIPGTPEAEACKDWMVEKLESYGANVIEQEFKVSFMDVDEATATNVIAEFNPRNRRRILLCAHWDSRKVADKENDPELMSQPIMGADDGASGVAALIEFARVFSENPKDIGIDIILFDAEDQGIGPASTWALGSQHWSLNLHRKRYNAEFGILLDMVGAKNARFGREGYSVTYAPKYVDKIWKLAQAMGYGDLFQNFNAPQITDDHYWINVQAKIPTVDIINLPENRGGFGKYHHTHADDIDNIDPRTLRVVGQVVTAVVYKSYDQSI